MNISFSPQYQTGSLNLSYRSNANLSKNALVKSQKNEKSNDMKKNSIFRNSIGISLGGNSKKNSILRSLMEKKTNLIDSKNAFMEKALKNGEDPLSIKEKTESIDQQIEEIDKQINKIQLEEQRKSMGNEDKDKKSEKAKQTSNGVSSNGVKKDSSMDNILSLSSNLTKTKNLSSQRNIMVADAKVLEAEIKVDKGRGINPVEKRKHLAKMKDNIGDITEKLGEYLNDVNTKIKNNTKSNVVNKNEQIKDVTRNRNTENSVELLMKQQQASQKIKHYKDNINYKAKYKGEKMDIIA